jgi:hypothetical protein
MQLVGKHTARVFDRDNNLIDEQVAYNIITNAGRERIFDIWKFNMSSVNPDHKFFYGFQPVDLTPTAVNGGTRRNTFYDCGYMTGAATSKYGWDTTLCGQYNRDNSHINNNGLPTSEVDGVFYPGNNRATKFYYRVNSNNFQYNYRAFDICRIDTTEDFTVDTSSGNMTIDLIGTNLKYCADADKRNALKVTSYDGTVTYNITSDYTFDRITGIVIILSAGGITNGTHIKVIYKWHDPTPLVDGVVGMYWNAWSFNYNGIIYYNRCINDGAYSINCGESWLEGGLPWLGNNLTSRESPTRYMMSGEMQFDRDQNQNHRYSLYFPYVINKPTNFSFCMGTWENYDMYIKKWYLLKPVYQPQTPGAIALGIGDTAATITDTQLENQIIKLPVLHRGRTGNTIGVWSAYLDYSQCNGSTIKEVGLFHGNQWKESEDAGWTFLTPIKASSCNSLFSRTVYGTPIVKTAEKRIEMTYELEFSQ